MNKSKKMEVNEMIKPNIINGLDLMFSSRLSLLFAEDKFLSFFLFIRFGKGLITIKLIFKLITYIFEHFAPWRAKFGIHMEFTPVISCQNVVDYHKDLFKTLG